MEKYIEILLYLTKPYLLHSMSAGGVIRISSSSMLDVQLNAIRAV